MKKAPIDHPEKPTIIRLEEKLVYSEASNKWLKLYFDLVRFPNGSTGRYNRIVEGSTGRGLVIIPRDDNDEVCLIRIFRYPINMWQWELPRGFTESKTSAEINVRRELLEETGLYTGKISKVGELFPNSGILSTITEVFLAEQLTHRSEPKGEISESLSGVRFFGFDEIDKLIAEGELRDGLTLSALFIARTKGIL